MRPDDPTSSAETGSDAPRPPEPASDLIGAEVAGRYRVLGRLGEGGFGVVYEAEQHRPVRRRVALKVLKPGMDSRSVLARFEAERQALAVMDHPNIAKVLDAGETERGLPFFAMELVSGVPITEHCDRRRLGIRDRLDLFAQVCEAVQHAHTKAIIHRDIKPSNVLVQESAGVPAVPKVIDFGVAKALSQPLTEKTLFTDRGHAIGTPEYMSPEQAGVGGADVDTRSDVYSLGVLLYELLTGVRPFDLRRAALVEAQRIIRDVDPPRPSTRLTELGDTAAQVAEQRRLDPRSLSGELRRELEWIPLKALRKDRDERYRTAADLAQDVRRYLGGEALEAGPESAAYRARKFLRRYRGQAAAVGAVMLVLVLGIVGTGYGLLWALDERDRADEAVVQASEEATRANEEASAARRAEAAQARLAEEARQAEEAQARLAEEARRERDAAELARETIEYNSYVANIQMAGASLEQGMYVSARDRLDAARNRHSTWEWQWLRAQTDTSLLELTGHTAALRSAAFSSDGTRVVTASIDDTARIWDAKTGKQLVELTGHKSLVSSAAFSPDGTRVVTASIDDSARIWDSHTGVQLVELIGHTDDVGSAAFSQDGTRVFTLSDDETARIWDAITGKQLIELKINTDRRRSASFSPDGTRVVDITMVNTARIRDANTGAQLAELVGHTDRVFSAALSADGTRVVTASADGTARIWDADTGTELVELTGHTDMVRGPTFSPDGVRVVAVSGADAAVIWDAETGAQLWELDGHTARVFDAEFSPSGTRLVTASLDGTARIWDARTGAQLVELIGHTQMVWSAEFSPDGTRVLTASADGTARIWDADAVVKVGELTKHVGALSAALSPDGTRVVTASMDDTARIWDADTGVQLVELNGHTDMVWSAAFSPGGTRIVTASWDDTARIWDAKTGKQLLELTGHTSRVSSAAFSPDGARVVTASGRTARIWEADTGAQLVKLTDRTGWVTSAVFNPDGTRVVTSSEDATARIWDAETGAEIVELIGHTDDVASAAFSPGGTRVVTASQDTTARIWDSDTGEQVAVLAGHGRGAPVPYVPDASRVTVACAQFSPDGTRVVTGSEDGTARVWDAATGAQLVVMRVDIGGVRSTQFSLDGTRILTASLGGTTRIWDSVPYRVRYAERRANARGEDGSAIVKAWLEAVRTGTDDDFTLPPLD